MNFFQNISTMICGLNCSLSITNDNNVIVVGNNEYGKLACFYESTKKNIFPSKQVNNLKNIKLISCGDNHSVFLDFDGYVFTVGSNTHNELGIGKTDIKSSHIPQKINLPSINYLNCGRYFTMCISCDGFVYGFGSNTSGQLGLGDNIKYNTPQKISSLSNVKYIECGENYVICIVNNNNYYAWGDNTKGQFGNGTFISSKIPIKCDTYPNDISFIKCGDNNSIFLTDLGDLYACGGNTYGQLGLKLESSANVNIPTLIKDIPEMRRIECGYNHVICIDINNNLWTFGWGGKGQLGLADTTSKFEPCLVKSISDVLDISSGGCTTFIRTSNNTYGCGYNNCNQLTIKTQTNPLEPIILPITNEQWSSNYGKSRAKSARK